MPTTSRRERIARLRRQLISSDRWVSALLVVQSHAGEELFRVGGCWDRQLRRYVDRPVEPHVVRLQESQVGLGRALAGWLTLCREDKPRPRAIMGGGNRGSGKTWFLAGIGFVAMALEFPGDWQFGINITVKQKRECLEAIREVARTEWIANDIEDFRDPRTLFVTGSTVSWLSAQNPRAIRQAGLPIRYVLINEGQDQPEAVAVNSIAAIRNTGGLVGVATNPPQTERSDWVASWWSGHEEAKLNGVNCFVDNKLNFAIDQDAVGDIAAYLYATDQNAGDADGAGTFRLSGPIAYPAFSGMSRDRGGHIGDPPTRVVGIDGVQRAGWVDVTVDETGKLLNDTGYPFVVGVDFQREPGVIGSVAKIYRDERGLLVLHVLYTIGVRGVESAFSQALHAAGFRPSPGMDGQPIVLIGDGTGGRQNSEHKYGKPPSFQALQADGWKIFGPMKHWRTGIPWNPNVKDSRAQMHALLENRQILLSPKCNEPDEGFPSLVDSFRRAKVGPKGGLVEKGNFQHGPDGVRYLAWRFLPRAKPVAPKPGLDMDSFNALRGAKLGWSSK